MRNVHLFVDLRREEDPVDGGQREATHLIAQPPRLLIPGIANDLVECLAEAARSTTAYPANRVAPLPPGGASGPTACSGAATSIAPAGWDRPRWTPRSALLRWMSRGTDGTSFAVPRRTGIA